MDDGNGTKDESAVFKSGNVVFRIYIIEMKMKISMKFITIAQNSINMC